MVFEIELLSWVDWMKNYEEVCRMRSLNPACVSSTASARRATLTCLMRKPRRTRHGRRPRPSSNGCVFISTVPPLPPSPRACALAVKFAGKVHDEPRPRAGELARRPLRLGESRTAPGRQRAAILRFREGARRGARVRSRERAPRDRARLGAHFPRFRCKKTRINACRARPMDSRGERAPSRST